MTERVTIELTERQVRELLQGQIVKPGNGVRIVMVALAGLALSACSPRVMGNYCDIAQPIRPTAQDVDTMSDQLADQILTHDRTGEALCGWSAE